MKRTYVQLVRRLRDLLKAMALLGALDRLAARSRTGLWLRSLLSIYDFHDLLALDVPWWTFEAADKVEQHLAARPGARVFEWGSGASTLWLAHRSAEVLAIEHDPGWAEQVKSLLPDRATVLTVPPVPALGSGAALSHKAGFEGLDFSAYVAALDRAEGTFDVIVIDGRARELCLEPALTRLSPGGVIVFDNVDRRRYREAISSAPGIDVLWTRGLTPSLPYPTRTALIRQSHST